MGAAFGKLFQVLETSAALQSIPRDDMEELALAHPVPVKYVKPCEEQLQAAKKDLEDVPDPQVPHMAVAASLLSLIGKQMPDVSASHPASKRGSQAGGMTKQEKDRPTPRFNASQQDTVAQCVSTLLGSLQVVDEDRREFSMMRVPAGDW